jgi:peptidoglycan/LPS O-acetylase OafA/YrhL
MKHNNFDFLRLLFAVLVIFSHSFPLTFGSDATEPFGTLTRGRTTGGGIAVDCFFIISGYLIAGSFLRSKSVLDYLLKRVLRIVPGLFCALVVCSLLIAPGAFSRNPIGGSVNGSVWTIPYEFACYIGLLILGVAGLLARRKLVAGIFCGMALIDIMFPALGVWAPFTLMFLAGMVACLYNDRIRYTLSGAIVCVVVLVCACFVPFVWAAAFSFAGAYFLFWVSFHPAIPFNRAAKFGDFSYGTYLYAFPIQQTIVSAWGKPIDPYLLFVLATPLALVFAVASWRLIERPFLRLRTTNLHTLQQGSDVAAYQVQLP